MLNTILYFCLQQAYYSLFTFLIILSTYVSGNCETWRNRYTDEVHLSQIGTLATKEISHISLTLSLTITKGINSLFAHKLKMIMNFSYFYSANIPINR